MVATADKESAHPGEAVDGFVPGDSTGNDDLNEDGNEVHVTKGLVPGLEGEGQRERKRKNG